MKALRAYSAVLDAQGRDVGRCADPLVTPLRAYSAVLAARSLGRI
jgi:hypothetical protein